MTTSAGWPPKKIGMLFAVVGCVSLVVNPFGYAGEASFLANLLFICSLGAIAGAVRTERLNSVSAIRCAVGSYIVLTALLLTPPMAMPFKLAPLGILILGECLDPAPQNRWPDKLPAAWREAVAFGIAVAGCALLKSGFGFQSWGEGQITFTKLLGGFALTGVAFAMMLTSLDIHRIREILLGSYSAVLLTSVAVLALGAVGVSDGWRTANVVVTVMLLYQVWRHWNRDDALLKIAETFAGAMLLMRSAAFAEDASKALDPFFIVFSGPMLLLGLAGVAFGLILIWSQRCWCGSILAKFQSK